MRILKQSTPILVLGVLTLIFFWKILLTNLILVGVDAFLYFYPYKAYMTDALLSGRFPLWNPHIFMGVPFLANSQVGLLYPLNWLFLWASPPKQVAYSTGLHIWIAGAGAYLFARLRLNLSVLAALVGGMAFAFGGFLGGQVEHVNQLQVSAWLPWALLTFDGLLPSEIDSGRLQHLWHARQRTAILGLIIGLMLLAGHTQSVYISMFGLGLYGLFQRGIPLSWQVPRQFLRTIFASSLDTLLLVPAIVLAVLIAAAQLLPTAELANLSLRGDGLTYFEAVAFSLNPLKSWLTIFPPFGVDLEAQLGPAFSEFVAYIGLIPLGLAIWGVVQLFASNKDAKGFSEAMQAKIDPKLQPKFRVWALCLMGLAGFFLAFGVYTGPIYLGLYLLVPGFDLFRVPARWLLLYTFALSMLAAVGFARVQTMRHLISRWQWLALILIPAELFLASQNLRYNQPTAPEAFSSLRPAIAQLLVAQAPYERFLSLSGIEYDPGDLAEINDIFGDQLSERAVYDYVIAAKQKEVLFFNLPMVFGLNAIDGYDGGLLPLERFMDWQRLFLPEDSLSSDGRLREKLEHVPPGRLLSMFGVRHIITDKVQDVWLNDIFYDLQFPAHLSPTTRPEIWTSDIPPLASSAIGVVFHTSEATGQVAQLIVRYASGAEDRFALEAGVGQPWENAEYGVDYNVVFDIRGDETITEIGLSAAAPVTVRGLSLIQAASTTSRSILLSTEGNYRMIHGGDVKLYENLNAFPPAFIVHHTEIVTSTAAAVTTLRNPMFDPATTMVRLARPDETAGLISLPDNAATAATSEDVVSVRSYAPERIELTATLSQPGWLVLMDTHYPGWQAQIDGAEAEILEANIMFRAVALPAGTHEIVFVYRSRSFYAGVILSIIGIFVFLWLFRGNRHQAH